MIVYRLTEYSGQNDNYCEFGLGIYVSKQMALDAKKQYEKINEEAEEQFLLCGECIDEYDACKQMCLSYRECKNNKKMCENMMQSWEPKFYRINEEKLIE